MKNMNPSAAFFCLCMIAAYSAGEKPNKNKREVSGLYPFPRVGKGDVSWTPQIFGPREMKRQGLIPFPRVGRDNGDDNYGKKRDVTENRGGMWFGPRLGRLQKRNYLDEDPSWTLVRIGDLPQLEEVKDLYSPKLSREPSGQTGQSKDYRL